MYTVYLKERKQQIMQSSRNDRYNANLELQEYKSKYAWEGE